MLVYENLCRPLLSLICQPACLNETNQTTYCIHINFIRAQPKAENKSLTLSVYMIYNNVHELYIVRI